MSNYYDYREVKVMIAHKLMAMDGWNVYGYTPDESDSMTDYYSPAHWGGVAEKNGYVLCVDVYGAAKAEEIRVYNHEAFTYDKNIMDKISKLEAMTVERGASEAEEASAKMMIKRLQKKSEESMENKSKYIVTGIIPAHMEHPSKCNWHIEKDGIIIAKGNGILKYRSINNYYNYPQYIKDMKDFRTMKRADYKNKLVEEYMHRWNDEKERAEASAEEHIQDMEEKKKLVDSFEKFINKIDTTCGGLIGEGDGTIYEKVIVTEYKKENKVLETASGSIKEGQLFILKSNFNYGCYKGLVYRIHETEYNGKKSYHAYKLNGKLTKECTGNASRNNYWFVGNVDDERFLKWIEKGSIAWCELQEVETPYEVEKVVKKTIKSTPKKESATTSNNTTISNVEVENLHFEVTEDTDTRTNEKIYLIKVTEKLNREDYIKVNNYIKSLGGYYSRFKHAFLFKENPMEKLNGINSDESETITEKSEKKKTTTETTAETVTEETEENTINYIITEDIHTKTGEKLYLVKPDAELSKTDFAEVKRKFAILKGYYSSFKKAFIFKYDPTEKLKLA